MPEAFTYEHRLLSELVMPVQEKITSGRDASLPYVGLEQIPARGGYLGRWLSSGASISTNSVFRAGDILFGKLRPNLRKCVTAPFDGYCSTDILVLRAHPSVDPRFANRVFRSEFVGRAAEQTAIGTKMPRTSWQALASLTTFCPDSKEQKLIADILDGIDEAIRQAQLTVAKLKQVSRGLLHDLLTRGIDSNGQLRGMHRRKSDFPNLLAHDETPPGWATGTLEKWLKEPPKNGYSPQEAGNWTGKVMLGLGCLTVNGFVPSQIKNAPLDDHGVDAALLNDGDLLMSRSNTRDLVGLAGVFSSVGSPCAYPDLMMRLVPTEETSARFLELVLRSSYVRKQIQAAASGTSGSMAKINSTIVRNLRIAMPDKPEQDTILERVEPMRERLAMEAQRLKALLNIKAGLTDDLLTGRVRVTSLLDK